MITLFNWRQLSNALFLIVVTLSGIVILVNPVRSNTLGSMDVRLLGRVMLVRLLHPLNALSPMNVTLSGKVTLASPLQPLNADPSIDVTLSGIVMLLSFLQFKKAQRPIEVTLSGIVMSGRLIQS